MAESFPLDVEIGAISAVDVPHNLGQVAGRRRQQQMIMVAHQAVGVDHRMVAFCSGFQVG